MAKAVGDSMVVEKDLEVLECGMAKDMCVVEPVVVAGCFGKSVGTLGVSEPDAESGYVLTERLA